MAQELLFTSAPKGLKPGSSGPCIVLMTNSMPPLLMQRLEALSGYAPAHDGQAPIVSLSHVLVDMNGMRRHVVSRVADAGTDHAGRPNRIAHHLVLHGEELGLAGPSWLAQQPVFRTAWDGITAYLEGEAWLPEGPAQPVHVCANWKTVAGDAGWAGVVAEAALAPSPKPVWIIHRRSVPVLALLDEVLSIVPTRERWKVTFSTHFTQPMPGAECTVRFCLAGSDAAQASRHGDGLVIDLAAPGLLDRAGGLVAVARTGRAASAAQPAAPAPVTPVDLEPERRGKRVVPMLDTKPATRIDPSKRQASMPALDVGGDSVDQSPSGASSTRRGFGPVPWLPWAVALAVTAWAAIVTIRLMRQEPAAPTAAPLAEITPVDGERDAMRGRIIELEQAAAAATSEKRDLEARISELEAAAERSREALAEFEARTAERERSAAPAPQVVEPPAVDGSSPDASSTEPADGAVARDSVLKRPQPASGAQRLGDAAGSSIELQWPTGAITDLAWSGNAIVQRAGGKPLATLDLADGGVVWTWDALQLPALAADAVEGILDAVTAATIRIDGAQASVRIDPRIMTLPVQRKALVPKPIDLRSTLRLPWSGAIMVQTQDGPVTVEPGRSAEVGVADELGTRGMLVVALATRGDRVSFSFVPDAALDQEAARRRLTEATAASELMGLVAEHDALVRAQPGKPRKGIGTPKGRDAYEGYLARHPLIAEKIVAFRAQGMDDLKDQIARDVLAAADELEAARGGVARGDALRARWPGAVAEIAPRGGQGFALVRVEATGP